MPQQTKIFRVFVSSTFTDMKEERRILQKKVFPKLEKYCEAHGAHFQAVDLRWGVNEESQLNQKTLDICLNEIARCQRISPKPNFLVLLGHKYGWQPLPTRIPETEMAGILQSLSPEKKEPVETWYRLDTNAIPPEYVLQPRSREYEEYADWEKVETGLRGTLREAALQLPFTEEQKVKYFTSATHQEIVAGALNPENVTERPEDHVFAFVREVEGLPDDASAAGFIDLANGKQDPYCLQQLEVLKGNLKNKLDDHCIPFSAKWENGKTAMLDPAGFEDKVCRFLEGIIEGQIREAISPDELEQETKLHREFREKLTWHFCGREEILGKIRAYLGNPAEKRPLAITGDSGSGKSSVMARAAQLVENENASTAVVYRFIGATSASSNIVSLLQGVCGQIARAFGTTPEAIAGEGREKSLYDINGLSGIFKKCLALGNPGKPVVVFLDALDQLSASYDAPALRWLPRELPEFARLVVSALPHLETPLGEYYLEHLPVLPQPEAQMILDRWLGSAGRRLTDEQRREVLGKFDLTGLPIYLKLAFEQAKQWKSYDPDHSLPGDVKGIINGLMESLEHEHTRDFVEHAVSYMLCGRYQGLAENEILEILVDDKAFWEGKFLPATHPAHRDELKDVPKIPIVVWSRLFLDLEPFLTERDADGAPVVAFFHRQFAEVLMERYPLQVHRNLAGFFAGQSLYIDEPACHKPNIRKLAEQPWQQTRAEMWDEVTETLCSLDFIQAKAVAKKTYDLIGEFNEVLQLIPGAEKRTTREKGFQVDLDQYARDLVSFAKGELAALEVPRSIDLETGGNAGFKQEGNGTPGRLERLDRFYWFLGQEAGNLHKYAFETRNFAVQAAWNFEMEGPVREAAGQKDPDVKAGLLLRAQTGRAPVDSQPLVLKKLTGHALCVTGVAMTPNGKRAVSSSTDGSCIFWDLETGQPLKALAGHADWPRSVCITPDAKYALSGSVDRTCILWDLETGQILKRLTGHTSDVMAVCISPDGKYALSGSLDYTCIFWDLETGQALRTLKGGNLELPFTIEAVCMTPDARFALSASSDNTCIFWDLRTGQALKTLQGHTCDRFDFSGVHAISMTPDGKRAISGAWDNTCIFWDLETGVPIKKLTGHNHWVEAIDITPDGKYAVSGSKDCNCILWNLETGQALKTLRGHNDGINALSMTPDGRRLLTASTDGTSILWNLEAGEEEAIIDRHKGSPPDIKVTPDGKYAVSSSQWDQNCILWDLKTGQAVKTLNESFPFCGVLAITLNGKFALLGSAHNSCFIWDLGTGYSQKWLPGHEDDYIRTLLITPDGKCAVTGSRDGTCIVWDMATGQALKTLAGHQPPGQILNALAGRFGWIESVCTTPDGKRAVTGSKDSTCIFWDLETGENLKRLSGHSDGVLSVGITPDGKYAFSGSEDSTCILWDLESGDLRRFVGHTKPVFVVRVTPDGRYAVSGSWDNTCILWDLRSGQPQHVLRGHSDHVRAVQITPDGRRAWSGAQDKTCVLWDLNTGKILGRYAGVSSFFSCEIFPEGGIGGQENGEVVILHTSRKLLCPGPGIVTARRIWDFEKKRFLEATADCPFCGAWFEPEPLLLDAIRRILRDGRISPGDSPCLLLPPKAWEDPALLSNCPACGERLKFNPFIAGEESPKPKFSFWEKLVRK